ncbi:MAG TPA: hypothetical protein VF037_04990 [Gemmatimonadales bacterium]
MHRALRALISLSIAGAAAIAALWAVASLTWPFGWDHGAFAWVGDVIVRGGMPYRDAFDVKGPLSFYPSALVQLVTGRGAWGIRLFDLVLLLAAAAVVFRVASRFAGRAAGIGAAGVWVLAYANTGFMNTAQPDGWVAWILLLAAAPFLLGDPRPGPLRFAILGAGVAVTALLKPHYAAFLVVPAAAIACDPRPEARTRQALAVAAGFLAPIALWLGVAAATGSFSAYVDAFIRFNSAKNSAGLLGAVATSLSYGALADPALLVAFPIAVAAIPLVARIDRRAGWLLGAWVGVALPLVLLQRPYYPYRLHILTPVLAILAASFLAMPDRDGTAIPGAPSRGALAGTFLLLALATFGRFPLGEAVRAARFVAGRISAESHYARYASWHATAADERAAAAFITDSLPPGPVLAWNHPAVAFLAGRPAAGRFQIETPVSARLAPALRDRYLRLLEAELGEHPPSVVVTEDTLGTGGACLACLPPFAALGEKGAALAAPFSLRFQAGTIVVYARGSSATTGELRGIYSRAVREAESLEAR